MSSKRMPKLASPEVNVVEQIIAILEREQPQTYGIHVYAVAAYNASGCHSESHLLQKQTRIHSRQLISENKECLHEEAKP